MKTVSILLYLGLCLVACGQTGNKAKGNKALTTQTVRSEPPAWDCCVFTEAKKELGHQTKIAADTATGQRISITGTVYQSDGKTPAANVLMYFYQTGNSGKYSKQGHEDSNSFAWWHGYTRGFLKTNAKGAYQINTIKPQPYPTRIEPAHIRCIVQAPQQNVATISPILFFQMMSF